MNGNDYSLVHTSFYDPSILLNRMGQYFYRIGDIDKAKLLFLMSGVYEGKFRVEA